jgi:hypothetical protein
MAVDLHRRCERHESDVDAVPVEKLQPSREIVVAEINGASSFDRELEGAVAETRRLGSTGERLDERLGPEVLVDVDCEQRA